MTATKIATAHLERIAVVYVRQSSIAQVREHTESTARQYGLTREAARLGWSAERISVIDADLGVSGRMASARWCTVVPPPRHNTSRRPRSRAASKMTAAGSKR